MVTKLLRIVTVCAISEFIQNIEIYPTSLGKVGILTLILLVTSSQWFSCQAKLLENLLLRKYLISVPVALMFMLE